MTWPGSEWQWFISAISSIMSHTMTNREWVTVIYFFARLSHQLCFIHDQQVVSDTALFLCQAFSAIMSHPMTKSKWVMQLCFFARQSHQPCLIPLPIECEWHCLISLAVSSNHVLFHHKQYVSDIALFLCWADSLIDHALSHNQQYVSNTALFFCWAVSSIMSHLMINSMLVTVFLFFARQSDQSCLIPWPTECEWHCFVSLPGSLIYHASSHGQQGVSDSTLFLFQTVSSITSCPNRQWVTLCILCQTISLIVPHTMINSMYVTELYFFARQYDLSCFISWPTGSEWHCCLFWAVSSIMYHPVINSMLVTLLNFFARQSHYSCLIPWPTGSE